MRLLHTADWHLGRVFHGISLLEEQSIVLDQLVLAVRDTRPDVVLIAGDIYDRSVPPAEAVALLDDTLTRIVLGERVPVVLIAGNHDGPDRLSFGSRLLCEAGLTVRAHAAADVVPVVLADAAGEVAIYPLPYADPASIRAALEPAVPGLEVPDHHAGLMAQMDRVRLAHEPARRAVVVAHAFVRGGAVSESERPLSVGGTGCVGPEVFAGIDYVALGHLHRPQTVRGRAADQPPSGLTAYGGRLVYSGSLMKYSFAEVDHEKGATLVELDADGGVQTRVLPLRPKRELRILRGELHALIEAGARDPRNEDFVMAELTDTGALIDPMNKLKSVYPHALFIDRAAGPGGGASLPSTPSRREGSLRDVFAAFWQEVRHAPLDEASARLLDAEIEALERAGRETP